MKHRRIKTAIVLVLCTLTITACRRGPGEVSDTHIDVYVSPSGNDTDPGTQSRPVASLTAARDLIRTLGQKDKPITVWIAAGEYELTEPFVLSQQDSGTADNKITWRAMEGQQVRLLGGRKLLPDMFHKLNDDAVKIRLTPEAAGNVYVADLKAAGITNYGTHKQFGHALSVSPSPLELYFNDNAMTLARYPNKGEILIGKVIDKGSVPRFGDYSNRGGCFVYTDDRHVKWAGQKGVWLQGTFGNGYADDKILIESIDTTTKQVKLAMPHMYGINSGRHYLKYKALNILDEIDEPGEWYIDRTTGKLYFWPPSAIANATIRVSMLEYPIICLEGVSHIVLRDVIVEVGRGIGIYIERGEGNLVAGCTVRNVGTNGIFMGQGAKQTVPYITHDHYEGVPQSRQVGNLQGHIYKHTTWDRKAGTNHRIQSCDVYNTGSGGIVLSGGIKKDLIPGNNVVENCKVHDYNRRNKFLWSGINIDGVGNRIAHCEIYNSDFQAIYAHGNDHVYEYNNIHHVTLNANDVSPWYLGRDASDRGNVIRYNYFHHIGNPNKMNMGIYCDDSTTGVHVYGNVFYKMNTNRGVLFSNGGWDLTMENNIVVYPHGHTVELSAQYYTWAKRFVPEMFGSGGLFERRLLKDLDITKPPYSERYPELVNYMKPIEEGKEWEGMRPRRNMLRKNLVVGGSEKLVLLRGGVHAQFDQADNFWTEADPGFVDMKNENFSLKEDSEVFKKIPDFKPVPFDKMGLYVDEYRTHLTLPEPRVSPDSELFGSPLKVVLSHPKKEAVIYYRTNQDGSWSRYTGPLSVKETALLQVYAETAGKAPAKSGIVTKRFVKTDVRELKQVKINFQTSEAPTPAGYLSDSGQAFQKQPSGYLYGWSADNSDAARLRGKNKDTVLDSLVHFKANTVWEAEVTPGRYEVTVTTGDSQFNSDNVFLVVEGTVLWESKKLPANKFLTKKVEVKVSDGRLTINSHDQASHGPKVVRLCSVEIGKIDQ